MSRATPLRVSGSGESMKLPPYLTTKVAPLNRWIYGNASSKVAALAMRFCMWLVSQRRLLTQRRKEAKTQGVGKWGGGDRHRSTYPAGEGAKQSKSMRLSAFAPIQLRFSGQFPHGLCRR